MLYFITKNSTFFTINCLNYLNPLKRYVILQKSLFLTTNNLLFLHYFRCTPVIHSYYSVLTTKYVNAKLQEVTKQAIFKDINNRLFVDFMKNKSHFKK